MCYEYYGRIINLGIKIRMLAYESVSLTLPYKPLHGQHPFLKNMKIFLAEGRSYKQLF